MTSTFDMITTQVRVLQEALATVESGLDSRVGQIVREKT